MTPNGSIIMIIEEGHSQKQIGPINCTKPSFNSPPSQSTSAHLHPYRLQPKMYAFISVTLSLVVVVLLTTPVTHASDPDPLQDFCIPISTDTGYSQNFHFLPCKNSSLATPDDFVFSGIKQPGAFSPTGFAGISVTTTSFPGLNTLGMSFARADLKPGGLNVPHLHPRATEVAYVVTGRIYSGFIDTTNRVYAKVLEAGEVMVYPRGLVHFQLNVGKSMATIIGNFNSQNPGILRIPNALFGSEVKDEVLEKAFGLSSQQVGVIRRKFLPKKG